ncbi:MAG: SPOR domain-containing protein [Bacteroidales bacterium]|jgi:cell division protein FtsN|nr:SPOR domain-containing protein [Bacteroidales bacterium]MBR2201360.1 SPOR domain-containing protein [Bacteroidales bacterium]MBR4272921.1 SPOR domain-containing protein [Bacteroidales bacterium]
MSKLKLFGLVLASVALLSLAGCKNNKNADQASNSNNSDTMSTYDPYADTEYTGSTADSDYGTTTADQSTTDTKTEPEPVMTEDKEGNLSQVPDTKVNESNVFYIVAGSFTLYNNAQKLNTKLKAKGYDSKILEPYGQYHRVTVQQFKTVAEARAALPGLRKNIDQALWLLTR